MTELKMALDVLLTILAGSLVILAIIAVWVVIVVGLRSVWQAWKRIK